jgi:hypothetical protein
VVAFNNDFVDQAKHQPMTHLNPSTETAGSSSRPTQGAAASAASLVALDILRRTALHLASTPGGLRLTAGYRAWLQGLSATPQG